MPPNHPKNDAEGAPTLALAAWRSKGSGAALAFHRNSLLLLLRTWFTSDHNQTYGLATVWLFALVGRYV